MRKASLVVVMAAVGLLLSSARPRAQSEGDPALLARMAAINPQLRAGAGLNLAVEQIEFFTIGGPAQQPDPPEPVPLGAERPASPGRRDEHHVPGRSERRRDGERPHERADRGGHRPRLTTWQAEPASRRLTSSSGPIPGPTRHL